MNTDNETLSFKESITLYGSWRNHVEEDVLGLFSCINNFKQNKLLFTFPRLQLCNQIRNSCDIYNIQNNQRKEGQFSWKCFVKELLSLDLVYHEMPKNGLLLSLRLIRIYASLITSLDVVFVLCSSKNVFLKLSVPQIIQTFSSIRLKQNLATVKYSMQNWMSYRLRCALR